MQSAEIFSYPAGLAQPLSQRRQQYCVCFEFMQSAPSPFDSAQSERPWQISLNALLTFLSLFLTLPFFAGYHSAAVHREERALICQSEQPFREASLRGASASEWELLISPGRLA